MRVALLILGIFGFLIASVQSCTLMVAGGALDALSTTAADKQQASDATGGAALGLLAAIIWVVGAAFALGKPRVSLIAFGVATLIWLAAGTTGFSDAYLWAGVSAILTGLSLLAIREKRRSEPPVAVEAPPAVGE